MAKKSAEATYTLKNGDMLHVLIEVEGNKAKLMLVGRESSFARELSSVTIEVIESAIEQGRLLVDGMTLCFAKKRKKGS